MTFGESISACLSKYATFDGRASRSEYWWFVLFTALCSAGLSLIGQFIAGEQGKNLLSGLFQLSIFLPSLAVAVRRLHDTDRSGWWVLISFTIIGLIPLFIWYATPSEAGTNKYGRNPTD